MAVLFRVNRSVTQASGNVADYLDNITELVQGEGVVTYDLYLIVIGKENLYDLI